ncbi:MAG: hypothetical protein NT068_01210 [Candidatus Nomurabacteria bacterium]|nr:hypothetical protein [Candidatus Nomurabacteria bacterium]
MENQEIKKIKKVKLWIKLLLSFALIIVLVILFLTFKVVHCVKDGNEHGYNRNVASCAFAYYLTLTQEKDIKGFLLK